MVCEAITVTTDGLICDFHRWSKLVHPMPCTLSHMLAVTLDGGDVWLGLSEMYYVHSVFEDQSRLTVNGLSSVLFADGVNECISYHAPYLTYAQWHWAVEMFGWDCQTPET